MIGMNPQPANRRSLLMGGILFLVALGMGLGLGAFLLWNPAASASPAPSLYSTLPPATHVSSAPAPVTGARAPDFTLKTLDGGEVTLSKLRGQPVLINFWASWCVPCRVETPDLVRTYEAHKTQGFVLLGVNLTSQDSLPEVKTFVKEFKITYPVPLDETGKVGNELYRLLGLPLSVFINRDGVITHIKVGAMTGAEIDSFVGEILK